MQQKPGTVLTGKKRGTVPIFYKVTRYLRKLTGLDMVVLCVSSRKENVIKMEVYYDLIS